MDRLQRTVSLVNVSFLRIDLELFFSQVFQWQ